MRPTGRLQIGNYFGALQNWVRLQDDPSYDCFYFVADWHALTSDYANTSAIAENTLQIAIDFLASGLDPAKSVLFQQSQIIEHAELHLLLSMVTPLGWLERIPTYKEQLDNIQNKDLHTYGFLGYPALQTADIVIYSVPGKPLFVPVGEDQVSHVEFSRELVRRFNGFYSVCLNSLKLFDSANAEMAEAIRLMFVSQGGSTIPDVRTIRPKEVTTAEKEIRRRITEIGLENFLQTYDKVAPYLDVKEVLTEPTVLLTPTPRVPGLDGRKMSKSYNNAISLSESDADIRSKTKTMVTDPARKRRSDPGNPDLCPVYDWHKLFSPPETLAWAAEGCRTAGIGCIECKAKMADHLIEWIAPVRERRVEYEKHPKRVLEVIDGGSAKAREVAKVTMQRVREAVFGWQKKRKEVASCD